MGNQYQLLIKKENNPGPTRQATYDGDERLDVRDLSTRVPIRVRAEEVSPYRHTLLLEGRSYRILNVVRQG